MTAHNFSVREIAGGHRPPLQGGAASLKGSLNLQNPDIDGDSFDVESAAMMQRKHALWVSCLILVFTSGTLLFAPFARTLAAPVPSQLSDQQFWSLSRELSEEDGTFRSDNLLSNENTFQYVIPDLVKTAKQGRVYMGVGPEQNFTYIAALKPAMAVIVDIRHGNTDVHLMYKALFELSKDRAEFVSRLFSLKRPAGLTAQSSATQIFDAFLSSDGSKELYNENLKAIQDQLMKKHGFPLTQGDLEGIAWALSNFYQFGPTINYNSSLSSSIPPAVVGASGGFGGGGRGGGGQVNYASLMMADNGNSQYMSYLASEESFLFLKDLETRNMLVPVVGDFGGDKAIRAVGKYLKTLDATVSAFYLSNVEQYLNQDGKWERFCANAISLPLDETSMFIRSGNGGPYTLNAGGRIGGRGGGGGGVGNSSIAPMLRELTPGCGQK